MRLQVFNIFRGRGKTSDEPHKNPRHELYSEMSSSTDQATFSSYEAPKRRLNNYGRVIARGPRAYYEIEPRYAKTEHIGVDFLNWNCLQSTPVST